MQKTIFITISRGILTRNILRNDFFNVLKKQGNLRIVILFLNMFNTEPPRYIFEEFGAENVVIRFVKNKKMKKSDRLINFLSAPLVYTKLKRSYIKNNKNISKYKFFFIDYVYKILSKFNFFKKLARKAYLTTKTEKYVKDYFDEYSPSLVFATSIMSAIDKQFLKEAKKRNIKTISMPKSWDNLDKHLFAVESDLFFVQTEKLKELALKCQAIKKESLKVVGFPQFDIYQKKEIFLDKYNYCLKKGFDNSLPILFLGSEGIWSEGDEKIFEDIVLARKQGLIPNCNILIRPHFSNLAKKKYEHLKKYEHVHIDDITISAFFSDNWDPSFEEMVDFSNSLKNCDFMITFASTLAIDASYFDKPILAVSYGIRFDKEKDITKTMYETSHYQSVINSGGVKLIFSKEELLQNINQRLKNPNIEKQGREKLKENFCGYMDGKAGQRMAGQILEMLNL